MEELERQVTTKELADVLGVDVKTVSNAVERLLGSSSEKFGEIRTVSNGGRPSKVFNQLQATMIKQEIQQHHNLGSRQIDQVSTELEENQLIANALVILQRRNEELRIRAERAEHTNQILMHSSKLYTVTEIAKELGMTSAEVLNKKLEEKKVQYKVNGTWVPTAAYADLGYFEIKQQVHDNGFVYYDRKVTQEGRQFILEQFTAI